MPKILKVITEPNPTLRQISKPLPLKDLRKGVFDALMEDMAGTMLVKDGIGLAAPQVDQNIRLIVVSTKDGVLRMANPEITKRSFRKYWEDEGCLSVPNVFGEVKRNKKITCLYYNESGGKIKLEAEGLLARVIQHECDHLDGILFIDKAKKLHRIKVKKM